MTIAVTLPPLLYLLLLTLIAVNAVTAYAAVTWLRGRRGAAVKTNRTSWTPQQGYREHTEYQPNTYAPHRKD